MDMKHLITKFNNNLNSANDKLLDSESASKDLTVNHADTGIKMNPKQRQKRLIKLKKDMEKEHKD